MSINLQQTLKETGLNCITGLAISTFTKKAKPEIAILWGAIPVIKFIWSKLPSGAMEMKSQMETNIQSVKVAAKLNFSARELKWASTIILPATIAWWMNYSPKFFTAILLQFALAGVHQVARDYSIIK